LELLCEEQESQLQSVRITLDRELLVQNERQLQNEQSMVALELRDNTISCLEEELQLRAGKILELEQSLQRVTLKVHSLEEALHSGTLEKSHLVCQLEEVLVANRNKEELFQQLQVETEAKLSIEKAKAEKLSEQNLLELGKLKEALKEAEKHSQDLEGIFRKQNQKIKELKNAALAMEASNCCLTEQLGRNQLALRLIEKDRVTTFRGSLLIRF
jgi:hypothetical protein